MTTGVAVPKEILQALMRLRAFGRSKMRDVTATIMFLKEQGDFETIDWILANREQYVKGVAIGFEPELTQSGVRSNRRSEASTGIDDQQSTPSDKKPTDSAQWS